MSHNREVINELCHCVLISILENIFKSFLIRRADVHGETFGRDPGCVYVFLGVAVCDENIKTHDT